MPKTLTFVFLMFCAGFGAWVPAVAQDGAQDSAQQAAPESVPEENPQPDIIRSGETAELGDFLWHRRPLVVFADSPADPRYIQQMEYITDRLEDLALRDVVVLTDTAKGEDTALREKLRPRGFMLVLIGKDGTIYLRKPLPWDVREISRVIDKMPMRQQEMRDRRGDS